MDRSNAHLNAKAELMTMLKEDTQFEKIRLETKDSDKMSQNKQHDFVRDHFSSPPIIAF